MTGGHLVPGNDPVGRPRKPCELTIIMTITINSTETFHCLIMHV